MFMTHAPGAIVPPRKEDNVNESFAGRILGSFKLGKKKGQEEESHGYKEKGAKSLTGRLAEGAGKGALNRALSAGRGPKPKAEEKAGWEDKTWAGQNVVDAGPQTPQVVTAAATVAPSGPSFMGMAFGAFLTPLRGFPVTLVHVVIMGLAIFMLELSSILGLVACGVALAQLVSLRVRLVRDSCSARGGVAWPDVGSLFSAVLPYVATLLLLLPAAGLGVFAFGSAAFEGESGVPARAKRLADPAPLDDGKSLPEGVTLGHNTRLMLEAAVGVVTEEGPGAATRSTKQVGLDLSASARARLSTFVDVGAASGLGIGARVLLALGLLGMPMAFLCAVRLRSAYAALHVLLIARSCLRVLGGYLIVMGVHVAQWAFTLWAVFMLPAFLEGALGHVIWIGVVTSALVCLPMITADLLGRLYRSGQISLGWD
jgi:hypothetical protein